MPRPALLVRPWPDTWCQIGLKPGGLAGVAGANSAGHCDVIDNEAWTITRYVLEGGKLSSQTFGINDMLENTVKDGNI